MNKHSVEQAAMNFYRVSGFHCAESVCKALIEACAKQTNVPLHKLASGFGGGIGGTRTEICGALSGGIIAMGWLCGRTEPSDDKKKILALSAELNNQIHEQYGCLRCSELLNNFGEQTNNHKCAKLVAQTTGKVFELLQREGLCQTKA